MCVAAAARARPSTGSGQLSHFFFIPFPPQTLVPPPAFNPAVLKYDHKERLTAKEALAHPWLAPARQRAAAKAAAAAAAAGGGGAAVGEAPVGLEAASGGGGGGGGGGGVVERSG